MDSLSIHQRHNMKTKTQAVYEFNDSYGNEICKFVVYVDNTLYGNTHSHNDISKLNGRNVKTTYVIKRI